jgi:serine protease AprX
MSGGTVSAALALPVSAWRARHYIHSVARALAVGVILTVLSTAAPSPSPASSSIPLGKVDAGLLRAATADPGATLPVIVRELQPASSAAEDLVRAEGGTITHELRIIGGFSARVPASAIDNLGHAASVWRLWGDGKVQMSAVNMGNYDSVASNSIWQKTINLGNAQAITKGAGVGVAVLDTGVVPAPDLVNHVAYRVDFTPEADGYDRYGHGTHMAGIIAGDGTSSSGTWTGVAPAATLISVKVAGFDGATDVSVVIAGMQWIVSHRDQFNIRVLNLSFGTDSRQSYSVDPLDYAVERVWKSGVFVAVAAGNAGALSSTISKPADDPYVVTVGAADLKNTQSFADDVVADFSSRGPTQDAFAKPDLVAPGVTIVSVRDPNSTIDQLHSTARVGASYFKGTGTSQATAVVSGVATLMFSANPSLTPDLAKGILATTTKKYLRSTNAGGNGLVQADEAVTAAKTGYYSNGSAVTPANQGVAPSNGLGSLELSRGSMHVYADLNNDGVPELVTGEVDVLANSWSANSWSANSWSANSWSANSWSNYAWEANSWSANSWSANSWSGMQWDANSWSANSWSANSWSANSWSANAWSANAWSANSWSANSWSANSWSANSWSANLWS